MEHNFSLPKCELGVVIFWCQYGTEEKRGSFIVYNPDKHYLTRWSRISSSVMNNVDNMYSCYGENGAQPFIFFPQTHNFNLIMRKTLDKFQVKDNLQYIWPILEKTLKFIQNKESLRICPKQELLKVMRQLHVMWYPRWDPGTQKHTR